MPFVRRCHFSALRTHRLHLDNHTRPTLTLLALAVLLSSALACLTSPDALAAAAAFLLAAAACNAAYTR